MKNIAPAVRKTAYQPTNNPTAKSAVPTAPKPAPVKSPKGRKYTP